MIVEKSEVVSYIKLLLDNNNDVKAYLLSECDKYVRIAYQLDEPNYNFAKIEKKTTNQPYIQLELYEEVERINIKTSPELRLFVVAMHKEQVRFIENMCTHFDNVFSCIDCYLSLSSEFNSLKSPEEVDKFEAKEIEEEREFWNSKCACSKCQYNKCPVFVIASVHKKRFSEIL